MRIKGSRLWLVLTLMALVAVLWNTGTPTTAFADTPPVKPDYGPITVVNPAPVANPNVPSVWNLTENFDTVVPTGWTVTNNSTPAGTNPTWFQGNPDVFPAHTGATNAYAAANFNAVSGANTISLWLISPLLTINNGDTYSFWARTVDEPAFADRLQVRLSTNGACSAGTTNTSTGDFSVVLQDINPTYTTTGFPNVWTNFTGTVSGLPGAATGCLGFRYFVENGGPSGARSDFIGVDTLVLAAGTGPTATATATTTGPTATATATTPASTPTATATAQTGNRICNNTTIAIPDNLPAGTTSAVTVATAGTISDINVVVSATHSFVGDLIFNLSNGTTNVTFYDRPGVPTTTFGCGGDNIPGAIADDEGTTGSWELSCGTGTPAFQPGGTYTNNNPLTAFDGATAAGTWTLTVSDNAASDTGSLNGWCVDITTGTGPTATATATTTGPTATATATTTGPTPTATATTGAAPDINVTPNSFTETHATPQTSSDTMNIQNVGGGTLNWTIVEDNSVTPVEDITDKVVIPAQDMRLRAANGSVVASRFLQSGAMAPSVGGINLTVDDGTPEDSIGLTAGGEFVWLNRFTPAPTDFPFTLTEIQLLTIGTSGCLPTDIVDFYVYTDADGNPANGATHVGSLTNQQMGTADQYNTYPTNINVTGSGDVLILAVNRTCDIAGQFPATIDLTASQVRSWVGFGGTPANPPTLPTTTFGTIDSFGFPGNWTIRGTGTQGAGGCSAPSDIPWLTVSPTSGSTAGGGSSPVTLTYNSASLAAGTYTANICIESDDADEPAVTVPITLNVTTGPTAIDLSSFTSPMSGVNLGDFAAAGLLLLAGAVLVLRRK